MTMPLQDAVDVTGWLGEELACLERDGLRRRRRTMTPLSKGECEVDGRRLLNFASNDYLGLTGDPRLREAARRVIDEQGVGAGASALITGRSEWHERLERRIAQFEGEDSALLFPTGYAANVGTIAALVGRGDVIFSDQYNHASLIDGSRLSGAEIRVYPHADIDALADEMEQHRNARRRLIVTDGVFSMDGDVAPLRKLCDFAEQHDAMLLVDEAHGTGVLGENGRGACEFSGVESTQVIRVGTLSKAIGAIGGFVAGSHELVEYLWNQARTQVYSTALPPAVCAAACAAFDIIRDEPERRTELAARTVQLREALVTAGFSMSPSDVTPILPVVIGDPRDTIRLAASLEEEGFLVAAIRPPTVPAGTSRLRISVSAAHSVSAVDRLVTALLRATQSSTSN